MAAGVVLSPKRKERGLVRVAGNEINSVINQITNTTITKISEFPDIINLDKVYDGTTYKRVLSTAISAGLILLDETTAGTYGKVLATAISAGLIKLDSVEEGTTYKKVLATQISAGTIYLSSASTFSVGYDPSGKRRVFTATPTTPYDVGDLWLDSSVIKRCTTARASGAYVAGDWTAQTLDSVADGTTYSKVLTTDISAGHINLTSSTVKTGEWYDVSGVEIDATHGINIYGVANALTTRATKTGTIQCYIGADGKIYAGAGAVNLGAGGITVEGENVIFTYGGVTYSKLAGFGSLLFAIRTYNGARLELSSSDDLEITPASAKRVKITRLDTGVSDVTASRAVNTTYTNTSEKPIIITVSVELANSDGEAWILIHATVDPPTTGVAYGINSNAGLIRICLPATVPVGWKYRLGVVNATITKWIETQVG